jgi:CRP-like cAMP-binding protein
LENVDTKLLRAAIFDDLDPAAAKALPRRLSKVSFCRGDTVFSEGEPGETLYIIASGHVTITRRCPGGAPTLIAVLGASEMFGELAVFDPGPRGSSATALTDVKAVSLSRTAMRQWIAEHPAAADTLLALLARRQRRSTEELCELLHADLTARVARRLVDLAERFGTRDRDGIRVTPPLTRTDLAQLAGASRPTAHRVLADFTERGWIRVGDRGLLVVDAASLTRRAEPPLANP